MITGVLRRAGDGYVVTVPDEEVERHGWREGQLVAVQFSEIELRLALDPETETIVDELLDEHEDALRYLAER
jgi:hypothetical protein